MLTITATNTDKNLVRLAAPTSEALKHLLNDYGLQAQSPIMPTTKEAATEPLPVWRKRTLARTMALVG